MDLRLRRRLGSRPPLQRHGPGGADRISFLSDDMIVLILERLHCVRTAVRTGLLSRRWRGLWTRLTDLAFRGVAAATVEAAFSRFNAASPAGTVFQLDIRLPPRPKTSDANSLLRAAALFSPARVAFSIAPYLRGPKHNINVIQLPHFRHATSIELETQQFTVKPPVDGEFPALERLSISGTIVHIGDLVTRCPRLRVLRAKFRSLEPESLKLELSLLKDALGTREVAVSIDICLYVPTVSVLSAAAHLSAQEVVYTNIYKTHVWPYSRNLPCFRRATSIEINIPGIRFERPLRGEFSALERLCLFRCSIVKLGEFVSRCPRLRVLRVDGATSECDITVRSTSLQELVLGTYKDCRGINIKTPQLKQLTLEVEAVGNLGTSVLAPLLEKVSWRRLYTWHYWQTPSVFGFWLLQSLSLQTVADNGKRALTDDSGVDTCLSVQQLPRTHVLSMVMSASGPSYINLNIAQEIKKLAVTEFSVVDICLEATGHVYGPTLFRLLQALTVHSATRILKVNLVRSEKYEVTQACEDNCFCDEPKNWRSQSISLPHLEEAEIKGFNGENHGFDFLKLIFRCAPKLKKAGSTSMISMLLDATRLYSLHRRDAICSCNDASHNYNFFEVTIIIFSWKRVLTDDSGVDTCLSVQQLPRTHVLSMVMSASGPSYINVNIAQEIKKLSVIEFSVVDICLEATGHVYGATLFRLLQALPVHSATRILKVNLVRSEKSEVTQACEDNCFCDEPKNWRSQNISLPHLEEAEIKGFNGEDHGVDFLELIIQMCPKASKGHH